MGEEEKDGGRRTDLKVAAGFLLVSIVVAVLLYWDTLPGGFLSDDYWYIEQAQTVPVSDHFFEAARKGNFYYFRPLPSLFWSALYSRFGLEPPMYRVSSLALHLLAVLSVFALARRATNRWDAAGFSALFFSIFPLHGEAVCWVSSNADLFATVFFCLATERYITWSRSDKGGKVTAALAVLFALLAFLSKEATYVLPAVLAATELLPGKNRSGKSRLTLLGAVLFLAVMVFAMRFVAAAGQFRPPTGTTPVYMFFGNTLAALKWMLAPASRGDNAGVINTILPIAVFVAAVVGIFTIRDRRPLYFGLLFLLIALLPPSFVSRVGPDLEFSRTLYLPSVGFVLVLAFLLSTGRGKSKTRFVKGALVVVIAVLISRTAMLNTTTWVSAGLASHVLERDLKFAARNYSPGESALVKDVPMLINGAPFHTNSFTLSIAMMFAAFPEEFRQRGYDDRNEFVVYAVSEQVPDIEAAMTPVKKLRLLKRGEMEFDHVIDWDAPWAVPDED